MHDFLHASVGDRRLRVRTVGEGTPIVYLHGGFGSILERPASDAQVAQLGIQLVGIERPGFGASSRHAGRTLASFAGDVRAGCGHNLVFSHAEPILAALRDEVRAA